MERRRRQDETRAYISQSREATTRRRNILTGSLTVGLVVAVGLAGLAYWQRGIAVEERDRATRNFPLFFARTYGRESGLRYRPGAAPRSRHERGIRPQDS